jgi:LysR family transcriptional regulator, transcriptional activator of the cysJI operon
LSIGNPFGKGVKLEMDINQLKIFCMVTRQKSFSKAAKLLHMSQPAVSTHVKNLEEYFSGQLLGRSPQGVTLTKAGEVLYNYAQKIIELEDEMEEQIKDILKHENNQVKIAASTTIGNVSLPCSIYLFKELHPEVEINLNIANAEEVLRMILSEEAEIGVLEGDVDSSHFKIHPVASDELVFIAPSHYSAKGDSISLENFLKHPLILREEGSGSRKILELALKSIGYSVNQLNVVTVMKNTYAIKSAVEAGLGGSVIPRLAVRKEAYTGTIKALPVSDLNMPIKFNIVYPINRVLSTKTKSFIKFLTCPEESCFC